ncbi:MULTISPECIES: type VII secretion-associated serine protease mycosin [Saccharopolyspora]|uniref:Type VII secretion system ESX-1 serine protease mycosin MycP1 n=1 Tax=Saccharopolyspora gregorii TaxID=33914 RepID=A0ABP6RYI0_9PSEU|nr:MULTISPECIES: type VII secretion-associated serine protease mycosin [Saccharopolyspora]MCA1188537.1 type VII secretion-associated serine protease mycosin [Saccharopolyspora sp. 6T]MCA1193273.1 type VII secretion-associated serine protease mycosin [Saccharopolyspora sp. 6V]MCA1225898.1 type VII secretion-associated serine protease mycosin [Saccharopolyspora sp. 6M]MCA1279690.1 type VII secretion-associated serine protease mycosin [Saccharopolyspora sp. 7B]
MGFNSRNGALRRGMALVAVLGITALGPVQPALADETEFQPPPLVPDAPPTGPLSPSGNYEPTQGCMQANSSGASVVEKPWSQLTLGFERAHSEGLTGQGATVAVIDTGVNEHPRLKLTGGGGSAVPDGGANRDCDGHGTVVAGIIAAAPSPDTGFVGVAPDSQIMSIRQSSALFQDKQQNKTIGDTRTMAQAVQYATDQGASVINISQSSCQTMAAAMADGGGHNNRLHNAVKNAYDKGVVVVAAAGNTQDSCQKNPPGNPVTAVLPAWFDEYVLTVASVGQQGQASEFTVPGPWVDVAAPGEDLTALDPGSGGTGVVNQLATGPQGEPGPIQGTSFAAPYVSGLAVLIKQKFPELTAKQVMDRIEQTSLSPGGPNGRNDILGHGMIDPMAALSDVVPAEHGAQPAPAKPARLGADVIPQPDWAAMTVAFGGALGGIGAVLFTAFLINAVRTVRARRAGGDDD